MDTIRFDATSLCPTIPGSVRFNASLIESGSGYLLCFRNSWKDSRVYAARLDKDLQPTGEYRRIEFPRGAISKGHEDPRWFRVGGRLGISVVLFSGRSTHVCYGFVNEASLELEEFYWPQNTDFRLREKNWGHFEYHGELYAVYSIAPHRILHIPQVPFGEDPVAKFVHQTPFVGKWSGGFLRGGASPLLHNGEMYSFFHGSVVQGNGRRLYNCGVYTFAPRPPFEILRYTPHPIAVADPDAIPKAPHVDCIFPAGAVYRDGVWLVSYGVNDIWIEIRSYEAEEIERKLVKHAY